MQTFFFCPPRCSPLPHLSIAPPFNPPKIPCLPPPPGHPHLLLHHRASSSMLHCSACIRICIRSVFAELANPFLISTPSPPPPLLLTRQISRQSTWLRRGYTTNPSLAGDVPAGGRPSLPPIPSHVVEYKKANLKLELRWLKDPVTLADRTVDLLREGNAQKALEIVRLASKDVQCTVSWNHLIDYHMGNGRHRETINVHKAIKLYNEVSSPPIHHFACLEA